MYHLSLAFTKFKITDKEDFFFALKTTDNNLAILTIFLMIDITCVSKKNFFQSVAF